ncbi:MAG: OmpH family outer membrane protein [Flavobacteriales bacterium]|jgi:outer membrane protein|nr:OmpH family outer membrane protein [Flavobacteriales bacterium]
MKSTLITLAFMAAGTLVFAQKAAKFGHINSNELLEIMPEKDSAEKKLQDFAKQLELQLATMSSEYEKKIADYQANVGVMNDVVKQSKEEEIMDLEKRIREFQTKAQSSLQTKEQELMKPLVQKAKDAIETVAKENSYTYVFDSGSGALLFQPESDNLLPLVKKKLGLQ